MPWQSYKETEDSPQGQCNKWSPRSGKLPQSVTGGRERATDRKAVFSNSVAVLSLIERVMSNLTGEVVLQDNVPHTQRADVSGPVRPQHVEVRVEEKQTIHDVRKTRIHEYSKPAQTRGRDMDRKAVSFGSNHVTEGRSSHALAVKDETLHDATESTKD